MPTREQPIVFECDGRRLLGIVHATDSTTGVLVIVGGPQYRVGSHRQFLLLARYLTANNVSVMRFDYRGMGDSEGDIRSFEDVTADIRAAVDAFFDACPELTSVVLWGLCDAASAAIFYADTDSRVEGMILLNPWVSTEAGEAKAYLRHYYFQRLFNKALWKKILTAKFEFRKSLASLLERVKKSREVLVGAVNKDAVEAGNNPPPLPTRMYQSLERFQGWVNVIISGDDLTAAEFDDMVKASKAWRRLLNQKKTTFHYVAAANHTFSRQVWRDEVAEQTLRWVRR